MEIYQKIKHVQSQCKYKTIQAGSLLEFTKKWFIQRGATQEQFEEMPSTLSAEIKLGINKKHSHKSHKIKDHDLERYVYALYHYDDTFMDTNMYPNDDFYNSRACMLLTYMPDEFPNLCSYRRADRQSGYYSFIGSVYGNWYKITIGKDFRATDDEIYIEYPNWKLIKKCAKNPHIDPFPEMYWQPKHNLFLPKFIMKNPYV